MIQSARILLQIGRQLSLPGILSHVLHNLSLSLSLSLSFSLSPPSLSLSLHLSPLSPFPLHQTPCHELCWHLALCSHIGHLRLCLCPHVQEAWRSQLGLERHSHKQSLLCSLLHCLELPEHCGLGLPVHTSPPLHHHSPHLFHLDNRYCPSLAVPCHAVL